MRNALIAVNFCFVQPGMHSGNKIKFLEKILRENKNFLIFIKTQHVVDAEYLFNLILCKTSRSEPKTLDIPKVLANF